MARRFCLIFGELDEQPPLFSFSPESSGPTVRLRQRPGSAASRQTPFHTTRRNYGLTKS